MQHQGCDLQLNKLAFDQFKAGFVIHHNTGVDAFFCISWLSGQWRSALLSLRIVLASSPCNAQSSQLIRGRQGLSLYLKLGVQWPVAVLKTCSRGLAQASSRAWLQGWFNELSQKPIAVSNLSQIDVQFCLNVSNQSCLAGILHGCDVGLLHLAGIAAPWLVCLVLPCSIADSGS